MQLWALSEFPFHIWIGRIIFIMPHSIFIPHNRLLCLFIFATFWGWNLRNLAGGYPNQHFPPGPRKVIIYYVLGRSYPICVGKSLCVKMETHMVKAHCRSLSHPTVSLSSGSTSIRQKSPVLELHGRGRQAKCFMMATVSDQAFVMEAKLTRSKMITLRWSPLEKAPSLVPPKSLKGKNS